MNDDVIAYLRRRIAELKRERPLTAAGMNSLLVSICELEQTVRELGGA